MTLEWGGGYLPTAIPVMNQSRHYLVRGRVQGVGFRWFVMRNATARGLRGWVRNLPDGSVEVLAEGTGEDLEELERAIRIGPRMSSVSEIVISDREPEGAPEGFRVLG